MDIRKLKASVQLAKMRLDVDPSDSNQAIYDQAVEAYEACQNSQVEKIEQVSGDSQNPQTPGDTAEAEQKVEAPILPEGTTQTGDEPGQTGDADHTGENVEPAEKKTEVNPADPA